MLEISVLGGLAIKQDGAPLTGFGWRKAEALLVYLACNRKSHSRQVLATLLWEDQAEDQALANLRSVLKSLRSLVGPHLKIDRYSVAFDPQQPFRLDVAEMEKQLAPALKLKETAPTMLGGAAVEQLERGLGLYRGEFLQGFYIKESQGFEDWVLAQQEYYQRIALEGLDLVLNYRLRHRQWAEAITHVTRILQLDPLQEEAHRRLMEALALSGQPSAALNHYKSYQRYLARELDISPEAQTSNLYEQIRSGEFASIQGQVSLETMGSRVADAASETIAAGQPSVPPRVAQLKRVSLFSDTPLEFLVGLEALLEEVAVKAGETIFEKGELGRSMFIIVEGKVRVHDGNRTLNDLGEQDIFGEMAVLDAAPRLASVTALEDTRLLRLEQEALYNLMASQIEVVRGIIGVLSGRLRERVQDLADMELRLHEFNRRPQTS